MIANAIKQLLIIDESKRMTIGDVYKN